LGAYIWRDTQSIIEDFISLSNGVTTIVENGFEVGTFTNKIYRNTDIANRAYQALEFQGRQSVSNRWTLNGSYTLQLTNDGNYEGEATNQPGVPSQIGDYPEIFNSARHFPDGHLFNFQRHKLVLWTVYNAPLGRFGDASISGLWRVNSGTTYSLAATGQRLTAIQTSMLSAAGYPDAPTNQTLGIRGVGLRRELQRARARNKAAPVGEVRYLQPVQQPEAHQLEHDRQSRFEQPDGFAWVGHWLQAGQQLRKSDGQYEFPTAVLCGAGPDRRPHLPGRGRPEILMLAR
jgi:hypothetical protein